MRKYVKLLCLPVPLPRLRKKNEVPKETAVETENTINAQDTVPEKSSVAVELIRVVGTEDTSSGKASSHSFANLLPELDIYLLKLVDDTTATCLGLTCKKFYAAYKSARFGLPPVLLSVPAWYLHDGIWKMGLERDDMQLGDLLAPWATKDVKLYYFLAENKWVTKQWLQNRLLSALQDLFDLQTANHTRRQVRSTW
ncbi:hypothetical protein N431DRAFT_440854 [Stipitochalara longipes BDJ]|nr:hypothetical protein N431DRAFT_440854 [Stipitochalara longipes BDJ]